MKIKEKPITRKVMDEVLRIREKVMMYNDTSTQAEYTGDKPTFSDVFEGAVCALTVRCDPHGFKNTEKPVYCGGDILIKLCEDKYSTEEDILNSLNRVISDMEYFYDSWLARQEATPND